MAAKIKSNLTTLQEAFCQEYVRDLNATQAAIRAGYAEASAGQEGHRLLKNVEIRDRVQQVANARAKKRGLKAQVVLNRLDDIGGVDPAEAFDENGHLKIIHDIPREVRVAIKKVTYRAEWEGRGPDRHQVAEYVTVEFHDRIKANELLGKNLKLFNEKVEHEHKHSLEALVAGSNPARDVTPKQLKGADDDPDDAEDADAG